MTSMFGYVLTCVNNSKFKPGDLVKFTKHYLGIYPSLSVHGNGMIIKVHKVDGFFDNSFFYCHILMSNRTILFFSEIFLEKLKRE
jgi:hypothetical protein